jgi:rod shape-determining protein MreC
MNWFRRHKIFTATAGIVLMLCLFVFGSFMLGGGSTILGKGFQTVLTAVEKPFSKAAGGIQNTFVGIFKYQQVLKENEALKKENEELEKQNLELALTQEELAQLEALSDAFDFTPYAGNGQAVAGQIISLDNSNLFQTFTIDVGSTKGIKVNNIVVDGNGLVGRIREVGKTWSKVVSILDENHNISFKVLRQGSIQGVLSGNGDGKLEGYLLNSEAKIVEGDILVTSGVGVYPQGIRIGKVASVSFNKDLQLRVITVVPTVKFTSLQKVAVFL